MPQFTPVYRLPFLKPGEPVTEQMERTRYLTIDRQLEALFTFLGDGVMSGWDIVQHPEKEGSIILKPGSGVADSIAVATNIEYEFSLLPVDGDTVYYVYVKIGGKTPYTASGEVVVSRTVFETPSYLILGVVTIGSNGKIKIIDTSESTGRSELTFLNYLLSSISNHVHTGAPGEPGKIDLQNHVKGILSAANIQDLPASKITSGIFDKERFRLSHNDLDDAGTLTHSQLDSLIGKFQNVNKLLFGDLMTSNLIQLILSLKHVWGDIDEYFYNFFALIPGIDNNKFLNSESFIDENSSNAEIDYLNHRIRGKFVPSKEIGQYVINSVLEFSYDGNGALSYNPVYVAIDGGDSEYDYGYGYGYGDGLDYFDVLYGPYDGSGSLSVGVSGTEIGYGIGDFESLFSNAYGYGYGYEQVSGFTTTLTSTTVTLVPNSSSRDLHDKNIDEGGSSLIDDHFIKYTDETFRTTISESEPSQAEFLTIAAHNADVYGKRSTSDINTFSSDTDIVSTSGHRIDADQSVASVLWTYGDKLDVSVDQYIYFLFAQTNYYRNVDDTLSGIDGFESYIASGVAGGYDPYWSPDVRMDLIIESTLSRNGGFDYYRVFYLYAVDGNTSISHFLDPKDNEFFENRRYFPEGYDFTENSPALARIQAHIETDNLVSIAAYKVSSKASNLTKTEAAQAIQDAINDGVLVDNASIKTEATRNITGIYMYTKNDYDTSSPKYLFDFEEDFASSVYFPMGQRNTLAGYKGGSSNPQSMNREYEDGASEYKESTMLVDIAQIFVGGVPGFRYNPDFNTVEDITITFPDPVTINSISWISAEPSDSIVYILAKRLDSLDGVDSVYNENAIFTNKGATLNNTQLIDPLTGKPDNPMQTSWLASPVSPSSIDYESQMAQKYRPSGSSFPSEYNAVRSVSFKIVLLPSSDLAIAPTISSIIVNYTSNTQEGDLVISSSDQWSNYRSQSAITKGVDGSTDYVTIDVPTDSSAVVGKIKNMLYGTDSAVVEIGNSNGTWLDSVKVYTGSGGSSASNLPLTVKQTVSNGGGGVSGYVTNLQKRKNGNIIFLDQDSSRIIEVDLNYEIKKIISSEYAYKDTSETWMPSGLSEDDRKGKILYAYFNPNIGDYGVLYLVFSHQLKAWEATYSSSSIGENISDYNPVSDGYVDLSRIQMVVQATDVDFTDCGVFSVDRGVLCISLSETKSNYISGNLATEIKYIFNTETRSIVTAPGGAEENVNFLAVDETVGNTCAVFTGNVVVKNGINRVNITKTDYNIIFAPIQGVVAFDIDDNEDLYILKRTRPYLTVSDVDQWNTYDDSSHSPEPWYVKMSSENLWDGWQESTGSNMSVFTDVIPISNLGRAGGWEPNFSTGSIYGYRGTIQKKDNFLLMCISGEKGTDTLAPNGVFIFNKTLGSSGGNLYGGPEEFEYIFTTDNDYYSDIYPMAARFDPVSYNEDDNEYGSVYIAISDLKRSSSINSKSEIIKIDTASRSVVWQWGTKSDKEGGLSNSFALVVNDITTLSYNDTEVIVST